MTQVLIDRATLEQIVAVADKFINKVETGQARSVETYNDLIAVRKSCSAALANAKPAGWQPIETAPKDGTSVLAYTHDGYKYPLVCACIFDGGLWWPDSWESPGAQLSPTHWMPLPTPPKEQQ